VAVLLKVYANCIDGQEATANARIEAALGGEVGSGTLVHGSDPAVGEDPDAAGHSRDKASQEDS
jgi:hypothetical protein